MTRTMQRFISCSLYCLDLRQRIDLIRPCEGLLNHDCAPLGMLSAQLFEKNLKEKAICYVQKWNKGINIHCQNHIVIKAESSTFQYLNHTNEIKRTLQKIFWNFHFWKSWVRGHSTCKICEKFIWVQQTELLNKINPNSKGFHDKHEKI